MTIEGILKAFATEAKNSAEMEDTACAGDSIRSELPSSSTSYYLFFFKYHCQPTAIKY